MSLLRLLYPLKCPFCGNILTKKDGLSCPACSDKLPFIKDPVCRICGVGKEFCTCRKRAYPCMRRTAPLYYDGLARRAIVRLKKYSKFGGLDVMSSMTAERIKREYADLCFDMIVPIPSKKSDHRDRDFNQTVLLAKRLSRLLSVPYRSDVLIKLYENAPQKGMSKVARIGNVAGVYDVKKPDRVKDKTVLLIDDVITTGATVNECAKMLRIFGARTVCAAAVCISNNSQKRQN